MKLIQTLVARDEIDVIESQILYHLDAGVDFVIASDHDSRDGTTEVLERFERDGCLRLLRREGPLQESVWRTEMARMAATQYGADWVINTDADEFWAPWGGTLKHVLASVPAEYGVVWALTRHFVPRPGAEESFAERMVVRLSQTAPVNDPTSPYRPHAKAAHRGAADVVVRFGSHIAYAPSLRPLRDWYPADVLHFPFRSREQYERKGVRRARGDKPLGQYVKASLASEKGSVKTLFDVLAVGDEELGRGIETGVLVRDTRVRDALRRLAGAGEMHSVTPRAEPTPERVQAIVEGSALRDADLVRVRRRLDELAARVAGLDASGAPDRGRTLTS
jgi:hypothetical protein